MNRLEEILRVKRAEVERLRPQVAELERQATLENDFRGFRSALQRRDGQLAVIAEIKKASPSAGVIAEDFDPVGIAKRYQETGADALSVLTDARFFQGESKHLREVRKLTSLPVLRKDFIIDEIQLVESAAMGADAILLIVAALDEKQLHDLSEAAAQYQLDALIEVHDVHELDRALDIGAKIIGINNRDLTTFEVDLATTERLSELVPNDVVLISESGLKTPADIKRVRQCGVDAVLVGEALMRAQISIAEIRTDAS